MSNNILFPKKTSVGKRIWGTEDLLVLIPKKITLKKLTIKKGHKGGLQYHNKKNECGYLLSGKLLIRFDTGDGKLRRKILTKGQYFHFPPKIVHQEEALTDCVILEASTPHFNDRVRVEAKYGKKKLDGLPTTKINQIIFR
jgi:mannose-6-phosphate isomerase